MKMKRRSLTILLCALLFIALFPFSAFAENPPIPKDAKVRGRPVVYFNSGETQSPVVDGEFIIQVRDGKISEFLSSGICKKYNVKTAIPLTDALARKGVAIYRVDFPTGKNLNLLKAQIAQNSLVKAVDPNFIIFPYYTPSDSDFAEQWALYNYGQTGGTSDADVDATNAWGVETGSSSVNVWVIDSGISMSGGSLTHPDLDSSLVDPVYDATSPGSDPIDECGHGTHVAGIIGAEMDNAEGGTVGLCPGCQLKIVKSLDYYSYLFMDACGGTESEVVAGLAIAISDGLLNGSPTVINMSLGSSSAMSNIETMVALPSGLGVDNILFVAAAGNDSGAVSYPAAYAGSYDEMLAISASDHNDDFASSFSNFGSEITVAAPGDEIYSTTPTYSVGSCDPPALDYDYMSGTSMASPHVAALAGLLWSADSTFTASEVRTYIMDGAEQVGSYAYSGGRNDYFGDGRINACKSLIQAGVATLLNCTNIVIEPIKEIPFSVSKRIRSSKSLRIASFLAPYAAPFVAIGILRKKAVKKGKTQH